MPSDLVISVKQIGSYPPLNPVTGSETLICQSGGLGGPYYSVTMQNMIVNTLSNFGGPVGIGVGSLPTDSAGDVLFSGDVVVSPGILGYSFNAYRYNTSGSKYWQTGPAGMFEMDPSTGNLNWFSAPSQPGGLVIDAPGVIPGGTGSLWFNTMSLSQQGMLNVGQQITVARNANAAMELVTYSQFNSTVAGMVTSFNGRFGVVTLNLSDVVMAGGAQLNSPNFTGIPMAPTPALGTNTNQIATTNWVLDQITSVTSGVVSWNGRSGVVTMTPADITNAGGLTQITANASFLSLAGGTMQGPITMTSAANQNMEVPVLGQVGARVGASTPPATPAPTSGQLWWDSNGAQLYAWTGQQWVVAVNPPIPNTANFLPVAGGTITGPLQVNGTMTTAAQNITGNVTQTGNSVVYGLSSVIPLTSPFQMPSNAIPGTFFGRGITGANNLAIAEYYDGTNWRQYPGTGTSTGGMNAGGSGLASTNQGVIIGWAPPVADNAIITGSTNLLSMQPTVAQFSGSINGTQVVVNNYVTANAFVSTAMDAVVAGTSVPMAFGFGTWSSITGVLLANANGQLIFDVYGLQNPPSWYGWLSVATAGGGASSQANISAGAGNYVEWPTNYSSDRRLKSNIAASQFEALQAVRDLQIYSADWAEPGDAEHTQLHHHSCFMADEVEPIIPRAVCKNPDPDRADIINPLQLVAVLWKAVQELSAQVDALKGAA